MAERSALKDVLIIVTIFIILLLAHPWSNYDEEVIENIESQLQTPIYVETWWQLFGQKVIINNDTNHIGYFDVDYFGNTSVIHTYMGDLDPRETEPLDKPKGYFDYEVGDILEYSPKYIPNKMLKAYSCSVWYDPEVLRLTNINNGTLFSKEDVHVTANNENGTYKIIKVIISNNMSIASGTLVDLKFAVISTGYTYIMLDDFYITSGSNKMDLDPRIEVYVIK